VQIGLVGLGKMGGNMVKRLAGGGHRVVAYDLDAEAVQRAVEDGAAGAATLEELVDQLDAPRAVWVMVPHGKPTEETLDHLASLLEEGDLLIDGGNSRWTDSRAVAERLADRGVDLLDVGVSGGVWGLEVGYCMMIGGPEAAFDRLRPVFETLAPADGYARVGGSGAGHFVKMIHNAIEYAMLQSIGEGFECLARSDFDLDLRQIADLWQHGAVVRSWLLELLSRAFEEEGNDLDAIAPYVDDSGMGRWSVEYAVDQAIPLTVITQALYERFASRLEERFSAKVIAALRNQFGGHAVHQE
jgi:6-phosphogluconate dehydrogenase